VAVFGDVPCDIESDTDIVRLAPSEGLLGHIAYFAASSTAIDGTHSETDTEASLSRSSS